MFLRRALLVGLCCVALISAKPAWASGCTSPVGVAGDQIYSVTYNMMQFCNGQVWINMSANIGVGSLTSGDWCTTDGTLINCTSLPPLQTAAGSDTQIMYNKSGAFFGSSSFVWDYTNARLGIGTSAPASVIDVSKTTNAIALPVGSAAQRPSTGALNGMIRYNNGGTGSVEALINNSWVSLLSNGSTVAGGSVAATGSDTSVQYNKAGTLLGDTNLVWGYGTNTLTVIGTVAATTLTGSGAGITGLSGSNVSSGTLSVLYGGTGATTFTPNGVLYGNGTSAVQATGQGAARTILTANAGAPTWSAAPVIGTSVTTPLLIGGTAAGSTLTLKSTSATGSGDYIAFLTGSQSEAMRITSSGKSDRGAKSGNLLDVGGVVRGTQLRATSCSGNGCYFQQSDDTVNSGLFVTASDYGTNGGFLIFNRQSGTTGSYGYLQVGDSGATRPLVLQPYGGNVGIGTTSPTYNMQVGSTSTTGTRSISLTDANYGMLLSGGNGPATVAAQGGAVDIVMSPTVSGVPTEAMRIKSGGNVGIGTTSPQSVLSVNGGAAIGSYAGTTTAASGNLIVSGSVGIGTTVPLGMLDVENGGILVGSSANNSATNILLNGYGYHIGSTLYGNTSIRSTYSNSSNGAGLEFYTAINGTNTAEAMRITSTGNVGIGTTSPQSVLSVNGGAAIGSYAGTATAASGNLVVSGSVGIGTTESGRGPGYRPENRRLALADRLDHRVPRRPSTARCGTTATTTRWRFFRIQPGAISAHRPHWRGDRQVRFSLTAPVTFWLAAAALSGTTPI